MADTMKQKKGLTVDTRQYMKERVQQEAQRAVAAIQSAESEALRNRGDLDAKVATVRDRVLEEGKVKSLYNSVLMAVEDHNKVFSKVLGTNPISVTVLYDEDGEWQGNGRSGRYTDPDEAPGLLGKAIAKVHKEWKEEGEKIEKPFDAAVVDVQYRTQEMVDKIMFLGAEDDLAALLSLFISEVRQIAGSAERKKLKQ